MKRKTKTNLKQLPAPQALDCSAVVQKLKLKALRCCNGCHKSGHLFAFAIQPGNLSAAVCCVTAASLCAAKDEGKSDCEATPILDPELVKELLGTEAVAV